jgi:hypothetical protein
MEKQKYENKRRMAEGLRGAEKGKRTNSVLLRFFRFSAVLRF